jgi:glycosidase
MRKTGFGLLGLVSAAFVVGCGADVDKPSDSFVAEVDLKASASGPASVTPGTNGEWTFTVQNAGPEAAVDVDVDLSVATPEIAAAADALLADQARWTCTATSGSCAAASGKGAASTTVSLNNGGQAVFALRMPVSYQAPEGLDLVGSIVVGEDGTYPDPTPGDNTASASAVALAPQPLADFSDEIIYWAFTDRFANGDSTNDNGDGTRRGDEADPSNSIAWHGGDFAGITQKIEEGYFQGMGFTAIWISPVILQVPALSNGNAAYHGYWPEATLEIEPHFGTTAELAALVDTAHANGLKIIVDFVANHVGFDAQLIQTNRDWVRLGSECGSGDEELCLAGLPDLKQENPEVEDFLLQSLQNLVATTGVDGFRWDAQKHVNADFWTGAFGPGAPADRGTVWSVGEVFETGDPGKIAFYLDGLGTPSVLDFPVYAGVNGAVAGFSSSLTQALSSDSAYTDAGRLSTFVDNHDVPRLTSQIINGRGYDRAQALELVDATLSFLYANRGIPVVYYGTEIGMEGLGDPFGYRNGDSNREDMDFELAGDPTVLTCGVSDQGLDNAEAFGQEVFVRGGFNDWGNPIRPESKLINLGNGEYASAFEIGPGNYEFKIAAEDWSLERTADADVELGVPVTLNPGGGNTRIAFADSGCFRFTLDTSVSTDNPVLTVTRENLAGPLVQRLAALAGAREAYPALRGGTQTVLYDFARQCSVPPSLSESPLPGPLFVRGGFNDWADPAAPETGFARTGLNTYEAEFQFGAGTYGYKIATGDWSYELVVVGQETPLDTELALVAGGPNSEIVIPADGCYNFALDVTDLDAITLVVTEDVDGTCQAVSQDPDAEAFGRPVFVRGSFSDWADPASPSDRFAATSPGVLSAKIGLPAGEHLYKIASADWSVERVVLGGPTVLDSSQLIGIPSDNGTITITEGGCYDWTLDVDDPEVAYLTVSKADDSSDVFAMRRDLDGAASVVLVLNMGDGTADLGSLGGIPVDGLADGAAVEITGAATDLVIAGGVLTGSVPARTAYLISDR